ncbi:Major facilitator superfamily domain general substrate transporter [Penicillium cf. viridicatum]|uniref:Major facilitator superfamily domain general substrate transporter n=1 Tax=Penicillium cf. viridicatum TaxID=2972119 RepID=A0A9W9IZZ3_9EURO|nr:Major facilitator superfamily domain general substrate transporter [Penicillium cf. viridicatum]
MGLGFGCVSISTNLYVAECAPTKLRGSFVGTVSQFGYKLGTLVAFWSGYGMSFRKSPYSITWRVSNIMGVRIMAWLGNLKELLRNVKPWPS